MQPESMLNSQEITFFIDDVLLNHKMFSQIHTNTSAVKQFSEMEQTLHIFSSELLLISFGALPAIGMGIFIYV